MSQDTPSIADRARRIDAGAPVVAAAFLGEQTAFVLGQDEILLLSPAGEERRVAAHAGGILSAACDGERLVTGGDDGRVMATDARGAATLLAEDGKKRWVDHVALGRNAAFAWSAGKEAFVRDRKGDARRLAVASTVGGFAFAPKGLRLAVTHADGVTLWFPSAQAAPETLGWKGYHTHATFSPDGRYLVTAMQEPALHGWRLADGKHMRMLGYAGKVHAMSWTADGKALATAGASQVVLWPFDGKDGPAGREPRLLAPMERRVACVACHPGQPIVAAGYDDGSALLIRLSDGAAIIAKGPGGGAVTALAWDKAGGRLAFGTEDGDAGVIAP